MTDRRPRPLGDHGRRSARANRGAAHPRCRASGLWPRQRYRRRSPRLDRCLDHGRPRRCRLQLLHRAPPQTSRRDEICQLSREIFSPTTASPTIASSKAWVRPKARPPRAQLRLSSTLRRPAPPYGERTQNARRRRDSRKPSRPRGKACARSGATRHAAPPAPCSTRIAARATAKSAQIIRVRMDQGVEAALPALERNLGAKILARTAVGNGAGEASILVP